MKVLRGMLFGMILGCLAFCTQAKSFTDQGSFWLGGTGGVISQEAPDKSITVTNFHFSPVFRIFPVKNFFIGPALDGTLSIQDDYQISQNNNYSSNLGLGAELGYAFTVNNKVVPYFKVGFQYNKYQSKYHDSFNQEHESTVEGFALPTSGGAMIKLFDIVGFQIEPKFVFRKVGGEKQTEYGINIGFCAIGNKAAVSILGGI